MSLIEYSKRSHSYKPRLPVKKMLPCLGCGKELFTDAAHRFCTKCKERNKKVRGEAVYCDHSCWKNPPKSRRKNS